MARAQRKPFSALGAKALPRPSRQALRAFSPVARLRRVCFAKSLRSQRNLGLPSAQDEEAGARSNRLQTALMVRSAERRVSNHEGGRSRLRSPRVRKENHSAHGEGKPEAPRRAKRFAKQTSWRRATGGGRKAHPDFELKDLRRPKTARLWRVLDFKIRMRSGQPCNECGGVGDGPTYSPFLRARPHVREFWRSRPPNFLLAPRQPSIRPTE